MPTILVIDDNPAVATALETLFSLHDIDTRVAASPDAGLALLAREPVDLVVQDMNFQADTTSGEEGLALFEQIRAHHPDLPVILLTAWTHLESAVDLVKAGAADYLAKPWDDRKLLATVNNLLELSQARRELARHRDGERRRRRGANSPATATASVVGAAHWSAATTCVATFSPMRPPNACCRWPARWRAPNCRYWSPGPTGPARKRSPRSCTPTRR